FSDETTQDTLIAQITRSNGSRFNTTMSLLTGNTYNASILTTIGDPPGQWNITFIGNDTNNNINNTITSSFVINDATNPTVVNLSPSTGTILAQTPFKIAVNATDSQGIHTVRANITGTTTALIELYNTSSQSNIWNATTSLTTIGEYNITIVANDSANNLNATLRATVIVTDQTAPNLTSPTSNPLIGNQSNTYNISALAVDPFVNALANLYTHITEPNGSFIIRLNMTNSGLNRFSAIFNTTANTLPGNYTYIILANDTSGNTNITTSTFIIRDIIPPTITNISPIPGTTFNKSTNISISAEIVDNTLFSNASFYIILPNSTQRQISITNISSLYNTTFTETTIPGMYNISIIAIDNYSNTNHSTTYFFIFNTSKNPSLITTGCIPLLANTSDTVTCTANINHQEGFTAYANITTPIGTIINLNITNTTTNYTFNYSNTIWTGIYNITWQVTDTTGNTNKTNDIFIINDTTQPKIIILQPYNGENRSVNDTITISATITDTGIIDTVNSDLRLPNGSTLNLNFSNISTNYSARFNQTEQNGTYTITINANDSSNNINNSSSFFSLSFADTTPPKIINLICNPPNLLPNATTVCNSTISDNKELAQTIINITTPNGTILSNISTTNNTNNYTFSFANTTKKGNYLVQWFAKDSSNNTVTKNITFVVGDITPPYFNLSQPNISSLLRYSQLSIINISGSINDDVGILNTTIIITQPDNTTTNFTIGNDTFFAINFTTVNYGNYTITFNTTDTSHNSNNTNITITVNKTIGPAIRNTQPILESTYTRGESISISANINETINNAIVNITNPYGAITTQNLTNTTPTSYTTTYITNGENPTGVYIIRFIATDSLGNINNSIITTFNLNPSEPGLGGGGSASSRSSRNADSSSASNHESSSIGTESISVQSSPISVSVPTSFSTTTTASTSETPTLSTPQQTIPTGAATKTIQSTKKVSSNPIFITTLLFIIFAYLIFLYYNKNNIPLFKNRSLEQYTQLINVKIKLIKQWSTIIKSKLKHISIPRVDFSFFKTTYIDNKKSRNLANTENIVVEEINKPTLLVPYEYAQHATEIINYLKNPKTDSRSSKLTKKYPPLLITLCKKALTEESAGTLLITKPIKLTKPCDYIPYPTLITIIKQLARGYATFTTKLNLQPTKKQITEPIRYTDYIPISEYKLVKQDIEQSHKQITIYTIKLTTLSDLRTAINHIREGDSILFIDT
ncbi:MAG: Ig-like domain-containing protein, partial [Nanoarchaeota archaeon]